MTTILLPDTITLPDMNSSCVGNLKSCQMVFGFSCGNCLTAALDIYYLTDRSCSSQGLQLGETVNDIALSAACITPSGTVNASQQGGSSQPMAV